MLLTIERDPTSVTQQTVNDAARGFATVSAAIMPTETVSAFVGKTCAKDPLPELEIEGRRVVCITGWDTDEEGKGKLPNHPTLEERISAGSKFSEHENIRALRILGQKPNLLVAIMTLQTLISYYFYTLQEKIPGHKTEILELVAAMRMHWAHATNFIRMLVMSITVITKDLPASKLFDLLTQEQINDAFSLLATSKAFEMKGAMVQPASGERRDYKFFCPVQQHLRGILVDEGCLMTVVERIRSLKTPTDVATYVSNCEKVLPHIRQLDALIEQGGAEGLDLLLNTGKVLTRETLKDL